MKDGYMKETNTFWTKLIKPIRDDRINSIIENLEVYQTSTWDRDFTFAERLLPKQKLFYTFTNWIRNYVTGLESFQERYVCNGNTDSINHIFMERKFNRVFTLDNEYSYYGYLCHTLGITKIVFNEDELGKITTNDLVCITYPNSYNGKEENRSAIIKKLQERNIPIYIDVAYCGLTTPFHLDLVANENTYFSFTFSKTMSIGFNRIGLMFTGRSIPGLEIMNKIGYINLSGVHLANALMEALPCDYMYKTYSSQYENICKEMNLTPTDCILYGHDAYGQKYCISELYKK